jgi:hypothetical protein
MAVFYALLLAHLAADFLQPTALAKWTKRSVAGLLTHVAVYTALTAVVIAGYGNLWWFWLVILGSSHFLLDHFKYLFGVKLFLRGLYVFIVDQILHIGIIALVVLAGGFPGLAASPFLAFISDYWGLLPSLVGYLAGTAGVSVLAFEAARTFLHRTHYSNEDAANHAVISFRERLPGMAERTLAISLILARLYYLVPFSFAFSAYKLSRDWREEEAGKPTIELAVSVLGAVVVGLAIVL